MEKPIITNGMRYRLEAFEAELQAALQGYDSSSVAVPMKREGIELLKRILQDNHAEELPWNKKTT